MVRVDMYVPDAAAPEELTALLWRLKEAAYIGFFKIGGLSSDNRFLAVEFQFGNGHEIAQLEWGNVLLARSRRRKWRRTKPAERVAC